MQNTLNVQWNHDYYLCRKFTVYLNDSAVHQCVNIVSLACIIQDLKASTTYLVTVNTTESGIKSSGVSRTVSTLVPGMGMLYSCSQCNQLLTHYIPIIPMVHLFSLLFRNHSFLQYGHRNLCLAAPVAVHSHLPYSCCHGISGDLQSLA